MSTKTPSLPPRPELHVKAQRHLARKCPVMKRLIAAHGPCTLVPAIEDPFNLLVRCVISQQISTKAANSIYAKLAAAVGGPPVSREALAKLTPKRFQACGVSGPKQRTLRAVVGHVAANPDLLPGIAAMGDDDIRERLIVIKGIGPWTVDMFLMFGICRPDVLPVGDFGLRIGVKNLFGLKDLPTREELTTIAEPWQPYRTVATWYVWRSLDPQPTPDE
jgi:DNA-3-methyladenine glycosylase II